MKKLILLIFIILTLTGCTYGSYFLIGSFENNTSVSMSNEYTQFSGNKNKSFKLKENQYAQIDVNIVSESGTLDLYITHEDGEVICEKREIPTSSFTLTAKKSGKYNVRFEADKHRGSYLIHWNIKNN